MTDFEQRWIVVSGASSGIGRAIAVALAKHDARIVLLGRRMEQLRETAELCGALDRTEIVQIDLMELNVIGEVMAEVVAKVGRIYGLVHCAGKVQPLPLAALKPDRIRAMIDLNFLAGAELARAITRRDALDEHSAAILWISSIMAHVGAPGQVGYGASKGAVLSAARSLALELAPRRVRVNVLSPGVVSTEMVSGSSLSAEQWAKISQLHPLGLGSPDDVARAAVFLMDPANRWITGADLVIDGGYTLA